MSRCFWIKGWWSSFLPVERIYAGAVHGELKHSGEGGAGQEKGEAMCDEVTTSPIPIPSHPGGEEVEKIWSEAEGREEHKEDVFRFVLISHYTNLFDWQ